VAQTSRSRSETSFAWTRNLDSVQTFVKTLLTSIDFFARRDTPVTGFAAEGSEVKEFAAELHRNLGEVLPSGGGAGRSTPTSPYLRIRLDHQAAEELRTAYLDGETEKCLPIVEAKAEIADSIGAESVFNMRLEPEATLGDVLAAWRRDHRADGEARWFAALVEQVEAAIAGVLRLSSGRPIRRRRVGRMCHTSPPPGGSPRSRVRRVPRAVRAATNPRHRQDDQHRGDLLEGCSGRAA
jgi:hypothetical protein